MNDYCPGATLSLQPGGGGLDASLPPRAVWHITWDALHADGTQPDFGAVSNYLKTKEYCPTLMWNPFTGYIEQFYPASQSARALAAWNEDGAVNIQVEVFFSPGCVVDGVRYATVADTPLIGLDTILEWMDSHGIPRTWPMGAPQWQGNSRDTDVWNANAGHYGHCNVPSNDHTDPGPMPDITASHGAAPAPAPEAAVPVVDDGALGEHQCRVVAGDTLTSIAAQFNVALADLIAANGITDPDSIFVGEVLDLPAQQSAPAPAAVTQCVVEDGDTLSGIAAQFGTTVEHLVAANGIADPDSIYPGQVLNF